jgi:LacI family transcriptional regulator
MASLSTPEGTATTRRRPTLRDVAALAGVSFKTVSRVVNGEPGVSAPVAERVRAAAEQIGFRPNAAATALRRADGRTATVGVLLEDTGNPFFAALLRGVEDTVRARGVAVFSSSTDLDIARERDVAANFLARQVDALITAPSQADAAHLEALRDADITVVLVDRPVNDSMTPSVITDNRQGTRIGVQHLIDQGHRRIGYVGRDPSIYTSQERYAGYVEAMKSAGIPGDDHLVHRVGATRSSAAEQVNALLDLAEPPTAIFTAQDIITMTAVGVLQRRSLADQVALVGFDDFELADLLQPGITVVAQDPYRIGVIAASLALGDDCSGDEHPVDGQHVVRTQLIVRGSGEIPPPPSR